MCEVIVGVVRFLFWMFHAFIFYEINRFYPDHTPETEPGSVTVTAHSPETEGSPRHNQEITVVSQPERPSALDGPPSCNDPEHTKLHHSTATDNRIEDYVEILEEEHQEMRKEIYHFQQKFQQLSFIMTGLEEMQYENEELKQEVASMRTNVFEQVQQRRLIETQLRNEITDLQRNLEAAKNESKDLLHKLSVFEQTRNEILESNLKTANEVLHSTAVGISQLQNELPEAPKNYHGISKSSPRVNKGTTERASSLRATAMKWQLDCQSSEFNLIKENADLTKKLSTLQEKYQNDLALKTAKLKRVSEDNQSLKTTLDFVIETLNTKVCLMDKLTTELNGFKTKHQEESSIREEKENLKEQVASLRATVTKWQSVCQSNESSLIKENADLTKKLSTLQEEYQNDLALKTAELHRVSKDNHSLTVTFDSAIETLNAKLYLMDNLKAELDDLKTKQQEESSVREENEDLKEQVASLRETELKLMDDKEILKAKLNSLYSKQRNMMHAKEAAEQAAEEEKSLVKKHLSTIAWLKSDLESANKTIHDKILENDQLRDELAKLKALSAELEKQNKEIKIDMERLNGSVRKRKSDWHLSELKLSESNEDLKKKLGRLQTENQRLLEKNSLVKSDLETANKEMNNLRETLAAKEYETIEFRKELETLRTESERMMESCKATSLSDQQPGELIKEHRECNGLLETQIDLGISESSVRSPSSQLESNVDVNHQPCAEMQELLQTKIQALEAENKNLTFSIAVMQQAEEESQKTIKGLMMQYRLALQKNEAVIQATLKAEQAAKEQADALSEALTASGEDSTEESGIVVVENIDEIGSTDLTQKDADFTEKKTGSRFKRWLKKCEFRKPKVPQDSGVIKTP
ncbi:putative leucine-rich repeat-containing protein DDB_G0290503 [Daphnia magna]|uniref:putative leucine-rich repeat-containing protein DDB_G0290503 n=1 Tax=Daphnia magna TaxID=35525 RepID=UPI001E1BD8FA|nr:putative leucine-rich repeat-containing protein DDB_G0290503 [Daphnia magna]